METRIFQIYRTIWTMNNRHIRTEHHWHHRSLISLHFSWVCTLRQFFIQWEIKTASRFILPRVLTTTITIDTRGFKQIQNFVLALTLLPLSISHFNYFVFLFVRSICIPHRSTRCRLPRITRNIMLNVNILFADVVLPKASENSIQF